MYMQIYADINLYIRGYQRVAAAVVTAGWHAHVRVTPTFLLAADTKISRLFSSLFSCFPVSFFHFFFFFLLFFSHFVVVYEDFT